MKIFVSYARNDRDAVDVVLQDMRRARHEVWVDQELTGGQAWWDTILANIRESDVFVVTLSPDVLKSRACAAEYEYAVKCGRTILPVMVAHVPPQMCPPAIANAQIIDYVERTPNAAINLVTALSTAPPPGRLPDPLPAPPPVPMSYMNKYNDQLAEHSLNLQQQSQLLSELRAHLNDEDDRDTAVQYLRRLRSRGDITESVGREIDGLLASLPPAAPKDPRFGPPAGPAADDPNRESMASQGIASTSAATAGDNPPGWKPDPYGRFELRYWDGTEWTANVSTRGQTTTDPPGERMASTATSAPPIAPAMTSSPGQPDGPFSTGAFVGLIVASVLIPLIGIVVGAISLKKPQRRSQAQILLAVGIGVVVLYVLASA
jgi:hypothetical protein